MKKIKNYMKSPQFQSLLSITLIGSLISAGNTVRSHGHLIDKVFDILF